MKVTTKRLAELIKHHESFLPDSSICADLVFALRELGSARTRIAELETRLELAERAKQELRQGHQRLRTTLEGVRAGTHEIVEKKRD